MGKVSAPGVDAVIDHIRRNLNGDLSLAELAAVARYSPHYFHRVFKEVTGETTSRFTRRTRLERAVQLMRGSPRRELSSISSEVGFATPSDFSRVFRATYGCAPSSWDRVSQLGGPQVPSMRAGASGPRDAQMPAALVVFRPAARLAYVRVRNPWQGEHLADGYARLTDWLARRKVDPSMGQLIGLSWENAKATPIERLSYDLAVTIGPGIEPDEEIGVHELPAMLAVEVHCRSLRETATAWDHLYGSWIPASPYEPADGPSIKRFRRRPARFDDAAWDLDCSIGLRPRWP